MNKTPKKIWVDAELDVYDYEEQGSQPYIRADIVDELVELVEVLKMGTYEPYCECEKCKEVRAAIAKLEDV